MRGTHGGARSTTFAKVSSLVVLITLIATGCGASTEEQLAEQLHPVIKATSYGDDLIATCATEALLAEVGAEGLGADGITPELLGSDPSVLQTYLEESETAPDIVAKCLDAKRNFGTAFAEANDSPDSAECVATEVEDDRAFDHAVAIVRGEEPEFEPETDADLATECLEQAQAAAFLGLPSIEDVASPLAEALADSRPFSDDESDCVATGIASIGALRLDELEVTPASVKRSFTLSDYDFTTAEVDGFEDTVLDCVDVNQTLAEQIFGSWPELVECLSPELTDNDLRDWAAAELHDGDTLRFRALSSPKAVRECADARDEDVFGALVNPKDDSFAYNAGRMVYQWNADGPLTTVTHDHEYRCQGRAILSGIERDDFDSIIERAFLAETEEDLFELYQDPMYFDYLVLLLNGRSECRSADGIVQDAFGPIGFSEKTLRCMRETLTLDEIRAMANDGHFAEDLSTVQSSVPAADYFRASDALEIAIDECATAGEKGRWDSGATEESEVSAVQAGSEQPSNPAVPVGAAGLEGLTQ